MRIFLTGATGWVGSIVADELIAAGHDVAGLARSEDKARPFTDKGGAAVIGSLDDIDTLARAAGDADAVVHTAFNHDFEHFEKSAEQDRRAIEAMGSALEGSDRPIIVTSGVGFIAPGKVATEDDSPKDGSSHGRKSEAAAQALAERGIRVSAIRHAPTVHGIGDHGFMRFLIDLARRTGVSAYVGDGSNRWSAVHRSDAGRLYLEVLDAGAADPVYHSVAEEGIPFRDIAEAIGRGLDLPVESRDRDHFDWLADFAALDMPASSALTRERTGWAPAGPGLFEDLADPGYYRT